MNTKAYDLHALLIRLLSVCLCPRDWDIRILKAQVHSYQDRNALSYNSDKVRRALYWFTVSVLFLNTTHALDCLLKIWWKMTRLTILLFFFMSLWKQCLWAFVHHWTLKSAFVIVMKDLCSAALLYYPSLCTCWQNVLAESLITFSVTWRKFALLTFTYSHFTLMYVHHGYWSTALIHFS